MYKIIGADRQEYGPVNADEIRGWVREGRADAQTLVKEDGADQWRPLGSLPEFAAEFPGSAPPLMPGMPAEPAAFTSHILAREPSLPVGECLSGAWALLMNNFGLLTGSALVIAALQMAVLRIPLIGLVVLFFHGVFLGGLYLVFLKRIRGQPARFVEAFSGFGESFVQLLLAGAISMLLATVGACCCLLPGIYLVVAWALAFPLVIDRRLGFWDAMELSRKVITRCWFQMAALMVIAFSPFIVVLVWARVILLEFLLDMRNTGQFDPSLISSDPNAYSQQLTRMIQTFAKEHPYQAIAEMVVLLLVQPFARAVLMQAYEHLFGPAPARTA